MLSIFSKFFSINLRNIYIFFLKGNFLRPVLPPSTTRGAQTLVPFEVAWRGTNFVHKKERIIIIIIIKES